MSRIQRRLGLSGIIDARDPPRQTLHGIDRYSFFQGTLRVRGWVHVPGEQISSLRLVLPDGAAYTLNSYGSPSPDVAKALGPDAANVRFDETVHLPGSLDDVVKANMEVTVQGASPSLIGDLGQPVNDPAHLLLERFHSMLSKDRPSGRLLEVGSRARSGTVRHNLVPPNWEYSGMDVMDGPNVDVVGDAHELSTLYPPQHFDAVMAFSVLEHLLMPWKFVVELNRVLAPGAIGFLMTHQCWPLHDQPWDFWRFSDKAWAALFNPATGFEIIEATMGEPAFVVAARCHPATAFGELDAGSLASTVLFRKIAETHLEWPVDLQSVVGSSYPSTTINVS